jgi:N,N'-diacetyllegionaminate synthase
MQPENQARDTQVPPDGVPQFWPDIDVYFKGDVPLALDLIDQLQSSGVRTIKAAALHDPDCCLRQPHAVSYYVQGVGHALENYRAVIDRHVVPLAQLRHICAYVRSKGLALVLSVYDGAGVELAQEFGASAIKIPSSNIVHAPLIRQVAETGIPMVIDTGRSTLQEIDRAVLWARNAGAEDLLLQHSPPGPPATPDLFNLRMLQEFGRRYEVRYGLSDHHAGTEMLPLAVALGASVIEKGVCADGTAADIDIAHALPVSQVAKALSDIQQAHLALGLPDLSYRSGSARPQDRMGLVAAHDLRPGDELTQESVRFAFPTVGIPVEDWDKVVGRKLRKDVNRFQPIAASDLASA